MKRYHLILTILLLALLAGCIKNTTTSDRDTAQPDTSETREVMPDACQGPIDRFWEGNYDYGAFVSMEDTSWGLHNFPFYDSDELLDEFGLCLGQEMGLENRMSVLYFRGMVNKVSYGREAEARIDFQAALDLHEQLNGKSGSGEPGGRAVLLMALDRYDEAEAVMTRALATNPTDSGFHRLRGQARMFSGNLEAGGQDLDKAISLDSSDYLYFEVRSLIYMHMGNKEQARLYMDLASERDPESKIWLIFVRFFPEEIPTVY